MPNKNDSNSLLYCSFCGKSQHEVKKLIAGPSVYICNECVDLCDDIIKEEIAEITNLSIGTVKSRINRGRKHLQELLKNIYSG